MEAVSGKVRRRIWSVLGNSQRLDGGAMFGNAPRALWKRWIEPDELNRIPLACRCLLIKEEQLSGDGDVLSERIILCETGIGAFFEPKLRERFGVQEEEHILLKELGRIGVQPEQIDIVILSHLHFDHAGGLLTSWDQDAEPELVFPKARFIVGQEALERARCPHPRDKASFIPSLLPLLEQSGRLEVITEGAHSETLGQDYRFHLSHGHTPGQLLVEITGSEGPILFCGDLIPGAPWVHLPITMGYDRFPELLIEEKTDLLNHFIERDGRLFFTHDASYATSKIGRDDRGRFYARDPLIELSGEVL